MMIFQARISLETAELLEYIRQNYAKQSGGFVSKGEALTRANAVAEWTQKYDFDTVWNQVHNVPMPDIPQGEVEIPESANLLKVDISKETHNAIYEMKAKLPNTLSARSVTIGVVIREILKAAYIELNPEYALLYRKRNALTAEKHLTEPENPAKSSEIADLIDIARQDINQILDDLKKRIDELQD